MGSQNASERGKIKWLLIVGISEYLNSKQMTPLPGVNRDATRLNDVLHYHRDIEIGGTILLFNEKATRERIFAALEQLAGQALECDQVIIYFGGHGHAAFGGDSPMPDGMTRYVVPYDADADNIVTHGISCKQLANALENIEASEIILVLDCCYSGGFTGVFWPTLQVFQQTQRSFYVIAAAQPVQLAAETHRGGLLSQSLCDALEGKARSAVSSDGRVSVQAAYEYAEGHVKAQARKIEHRQMTVTSGIGRTIFLTRPMQRIPDLFPLSAIGYLQLSGEVRDIAERAVAMAREFGHQFVGVPHLFAADVQMQDSKLYRFFIEAGHNPMAVQRAVFSEIVSETGSPVSAKPQPTSGWNAVFAKAANYASERLSPQISEADLVLAMIDERENLFMAIGRELNIDKESLRQSLRQILSTPYK